MNPGRLNEVSLIAETIVAGFVAYVLRTREPACRVWLLAYLIEIG